MNLQQLEYVDAVSRHRSLRAAAESVGVTPQALSRAIGALERELATQIFERAAGGVVFTEFGARFHAKAMQALRLRDQIADAASSRTRKRLAVGVGYIFTLSRLGELGIAAFDALGFERIDWVEGANLQLAPRVAAGEIDFALTSETPSSARAEFTPRIEVGWAVCCRADHPIAKTRDLGAISEYGVVASASPSGHAHIEAATRKLSGKPARIAATAKDPLSMVNLLRTSDRLVLAPDIVDPALLAYGGLVAIPAPDLPKRSYGVLAPRRPPIGLDWDAVTGAVDDMFARFAAGAR